MPVVPVTVEEIRAERERRFRGEELAEEAARLSGDLRAFIRAAWTILEPATPYQHNWHIDAIAEHLEAAYRREIRRLIINIPPRRMKSLTVSVFGPAWRWTTRPDERFLTASYGADLAVEHAVNSRTVIQSAWYRSRWGDVFALTGDQNVKSFYTNDRRGARIATSVGGSGTGRGGDIIVIDDPLDAQEAYSEAARQSVVKWHDEKISTRMNDPKTGVEILVMQRLHEADLTGHLLAKEAGWFHLCLPEEYEPKLMVTLPGGRTVDATCPPVVELESGSRLQGDPRTEPGELLWPDHVPAAVHAEQKVDLGPYGVAGQLQQRPAPAEGGILKTGWWGYFDQDWLASVWRGEPLVKLLTFWDTALKDKTSNDYCVGVVWAAAGANRYMLRRTRGRMGLPDTIAAVEDLASWTARSFPGIPHEIKVENAANGPEVVQALRSKMPGISTWNADRDKVSRAHAVTPILAAGQVFVPGRGLPDGTGPDPSITPAWVLEIVAECAAFPNGANDDQVDAVTGGLLNLTGQYVYAAAGVDDEDAAEQRRGLTAGIRDKTF